MFRLSTDFLRAVVNRRVAAFAISLAALTGMAAVAPAQAAYPDHPVRILVPFGPGGVADITARLVAEKLSEKLGQNFVIENMPGPGGIAAAHGVLQSPADGYTLAFFTNGTAISVPLFSHLPFDPVKQFTPISAIGYFGLDFVVSRTRPITRSAISSKPRTTSPARSISARSSSARRRTSPRSCSSPCRAPIWSSCRFAPRRTNWWHCCAATSRWRSNFTRR